MALSKGLRLLWKQEPTPSALLEARGRQDCLLLEAGTTATLSKCLAPRVVGVGRWVGMYVCARVVLWTQPPYSCFAWHANFEGRRPDLSDQWSTLSAFPFQESQP